MKHTYNALHKYLIDNELYDEAKSIENDERNDNVLLMIIDHFDDEVMLKDSSTALLKDMLEYYSNHK